MAQNQAYLFLVFSLTGVAIGILFDSFRILRRTFKTSNIITYIEDVLYWILTGFLILYNIWYFNNGEIRIYMFLGIILGVLIYMSTLSNILIRLFFLAAVIMGIFVFAAFTGLKMAGITSRIILCGLPIAVGVLAYVIAAVKIKVVTREDCLLLPKGEKIAKLLKL